MLDKKYIITEYDNGSRLKIQYSNFNPFKNHNQKLLPTTRYRNIDNPYIKVDQYKLTLKKFRKKLFEFQISDKNSLFVTLTTSKKLMWEQILKLFKNFLTAMKRKFGELNYIRVIQFSPNLNFHIHVLFEFNIPIESNLYNEIIKHYWKIGFCKIEKVTNPYGIIDYMTLYKEESINKEDSYYTNYPQWVKFISYSQKFKKSQKKAYSLNNMEEVKGVINDFIYKKRINTNKDTFIYKDKHWYIDYKTGELCETLDREYLH